MFFVSSKDWSCCTCPGKNEKEEDFPNIGSDLNAKLRGKVGCKGGAWHRRGEKCVIWFQEGSPDSELVIQQLTLKTLFKNFMQFVLLHLNVFFFFKPTKYCYFLISSLYLYNSVKCAFHLNDRK